MFSGRGFQSIGTFPNMDVCCPAKSYSAENILVKATNTKLTIFDPDSANRIRRIKILSIEYLG